MTVYYMLLIFMGLFIKDEKKIIEWLLGQGLSAEKINFITKIAWESQRNEIPETLEGKILHDAHVLEGGKTYLVVKSLITGSVRGQSLKETMQFMNEYVLNKNRCYLPETIPLCDGMNAFTNEFYNELIKEIN